MADQYPLFDNWYDVFMSQFSPVLSKIWIFSVEQGQKEIARVEGANAPSLTKTIQHHATAFVAPVINEKHEKKDEVIM